MADDSELKTTTTLILLLLLNPEPSSYQRFKSESLLSSSLLDLNLLCFSLLISDFCFILLLTNSFLGVKPMLKEEKIEENEEISEICHSPEVFRLNYTKMERKFKVYIYPDGDPNTYYQTPRKLTGKYANEGYFFQNIRESRFRTDDPSRANLFFIQISCHKMRGKGTSYENMTIIVQNYVESLISKYPYWNRTLGADHFFVTCHDVGVRATEGLPLLVKNSIRVVCSPSYDVGFIQHKDVALPQVLHPFALPKILDFWAGHQNSKIRVILAQVWDNDTKLYVLNNRINRVNSAHVTDSIHYGCIPSKNSYCFGYWKRKMMFYYYPYFSLKTLFAILHCLLILFFIYKNAQMYFVKKIELPNLSDICLCLWHNIISF
ncbi:hypothetical protein UlMin_013094 [Ulmus minor]